MKKKFGGGLLGVIILAIFLFLGNLVNFEGGSQVEYDRNMQTTSYNTKIVVGEDSSYTVTEEISVDFLTSRHGIYRYIPVEGTSSWREGDEVKKLPFEAKVTDIRVSEAFEDYIEDGCQVLQIGDAEATVYGPHTYEISYCFRPRFQTKDYPCVYFNVFPGQWQNEIPAGSRFSVTFPKEVDASALQFYTGSYGSMEDGSAVAEVVIDGQTVSGTLKESLPLGTGLTLYARVGEGYFTALKAVSKVLWLPVILTLLLLAVVLFAFFRFGRDGEIIPSIQFQPPQGLDSACVGYIIDGQVQDKDVLSLLIYLADKGYLQILENEKGKITLQKLRDLPQDAPQWQQIVFQRLFEKKDMVSIGSLQYKFTDTIGAARESMKMYFSGKQGVYTTSSKVMRVIGFCLTPLPLVLFLAAAGQTAFWGVPAIILMLLGLWLLCYAVDNWYAEASSKRKLPVFAGIFLVCAALGFYGGIYLSNVRNSRIFDFRLNLAVAAAATVIMAVCTVFMKKRTSQCTEWMGYLVGLRDFIETAELARMEEMAKTHPEWFYHIIPYAYVFGLSDVFMKKLEGLELAPPQWYTTSRPYDRWDYYWFHRNLMRSMETTTQTLTMVKPAETKGGSLGRSISGGSSGGFSGGGFGGGGGGSW